MNDYKDDDILCMARILQRGISDEALDVLKKHFGFGLDVFQLIDRNGQPRTESIEYIKNEAMLRDGRHSVIRFIEMMKKISPNKK